MFYTCLSVILFTGARGGIPTCIAGGIPACLAAGLQGGVGGIPACLSGFQAHIQGEVEGSCQGEGLHAHTQGGS